MTQVLRDRDFYNLMIDGRGVFQVTDWLTDRSDRPSNEAVSLLEMRSRR